MRLIQLATPSARHTGLIDEPWILLLQHHDSIWALAQAALAAGIPLEKAVEPSGESLDYEAVYAGNSPWRILPPIDHPQESSRCLVTGTGLSHIRSATNRQNMHSAAPVEENVTDSMRMYQWGVEGGRPPAGQVGVAPEWFYKGTGSALRAHNETLDVPPYADDGGEEPEAAGIYIVDSQGNPRRIGMTVGNEFSDHVLEKKNYLYLASSKLRQCAIGPELVTDPDFSLVTGEVSIERDGAVLWSKAIRTGESVMCHSLANLEHHHFKYAAHRRPGDVHVHFFGADAFSFGEGITLRNGDVMQIHFPSFGRPLRNRLQVSAGQQEPVTAKKL